MRKDCMNYFGIAGYGLLIIAILFIFYHLYFTEYMVLLFAIVFILPATEKGFALYRRILSKKIELKFLSTIFIVMILIFFKYKDFSKEFFLSSIFVMILFCITFIILQWRNDRIGSIIPTWRDFLTLLFIIVSPYIFQFFLSFLTTPQMFYIFYRNIMRPFITILYLILFLVVRNFSREDIGYKLKIDIKDIVYVFLGFLLILILGVIWNIDIKILISKYFLEYLYMELREKFSSLLSSPLSSYIHYIFIVGLGEELGFRGLLLGFIKKRLEGKWYGTLVALLISSLFFGFYHYSMYGFYGSLRITFVYGFVLGIIFIKTKRLTAPILLHAFIDIH